MSSPSTSYHITVCCAEPSSLMVASTPKRRSFKNARTLSCNGIHHFSLCLSHAILCAATALTRTLSPSDRKLRDGGNDLFGQHIECVGFADVRHVKYRLIEAK